MIADGAPKQATVAPPVAPGATPTPATAANRHVEAA